MVGLRAKVLAAGAESGGSCGGLFQLNVQQILGYPGFRTASIFNFVFRTENEPGGSAYLT